MDTTEFPPTVKLVKAFIKLRDARSALKHKYDEEDAGLRAKMDAIEGVLIEVCKRAGANSLNTEAGTVIRGVSSRYWTSDWDSMYRFIKENDSPDLLERRISQKAMADFIKSNPDKMPAGLNVESKYTVTVRRK